MHSRKHTALSFTSDNTRAEMDQAERDLQEAKHDLKKLLKQKQTLKNQFEAQLLIDQRQINLLNRERAELNTQLNLVISDQNQNRDLTNLTRMQTSLTQKSSYQHKVDQEKIKQKAYDKKCREMYEKIKQQRIKMGGLSETSNFQKKLNHQLKTSEGKLQREQTNANKIIAENAQIREKIATLRGERAKFQKKHDEMTERTETLKQTIAMIIEDSAIAHENSIEAKAKTNIVKEKTEKEFQTYRDFRMKSNP